MLGEFHLPRKCQDLVRGLYNVTVYCSKGNLKPC